MLRRSNSKQHLSASRLSGAEEPKAYSGAVSILPTANRPSSITARDEPSPPPIPTFVTCTHSNSTGTGKGLDGPVVSFRVHPIPSYPWMYSYGVCHTSMPLLTILASHADIPSFPEPRIQLSTAARPARRRNHVRRLPSPSRASPLAPAGWDEPPPPRALLRVTDGKSMLACLRVIIMSAAAACRWDITRTRSPTLALIQHAVITNSNLISKSTPSHRSQTAIPAG